LIPSRTTIQERQQSFRSESSEDASQSSRSSDSDEEIAPAPQNNQSELRKMILQIQSDGTLTSAEKARKIQVLRIHSGFNDQALATEAKNGTEKGL
jgi:N-methylhydantoinase A/oxoprolinase/acetone carboxylase beta subunit